MDEKIEALAFYRALKIATREHGIKRVVVTMDDNGKLKINSDLNSSGGKPEESIKSK